MNDSQDPSNPQPQQLEKKPRTYGSVALRELAEDETPLAKVLPAGGPLLGQPAPECRRCPGCTNQGACHGDEGGAA